MKKIRYNIILLLATFALTANLACETDEVPEDDPQEQEEQEQEEQEKTTCRFKTIHLATGEMVFTYNEDGKITKFTTGGREATYQYNDNTIVIDEKTHGAFYRKRTLTLNEHGFLTELYEVYNQAGTFWHKEEFEYQNDTELVKHTKTHHNNTPSQSTFTWEDGNIVSVISTPGDYEQTYVYDTEMLHQTGDQLSYTELTVYGGAKIYGVKNALKSIVADDVTHTFSYQTDQDGRIIRLTRQGGGLDATFHFSGYECD